MSYADHNIGDREELRQHQLEGLQATVNRAYRNVEYYHNLFKEIGLVPEDIKSLDELKSIPFTTKATLRENYPYGMFAIPISEIMTVHSSAGTTGKPTVVGFSANDMRHWQDAELRVLELAGVTKNDIVQIAFGSSFFTGGFGLHYGVEKLEATLIPTSSVDLERHVVMILDYRVTTLISTPSYVYALIDTIEHMDIRKEDLHINKVLLGGEPWAEEQRQYIENRLGVKAFDNYGLSEIFGSGIASECEERSGLHIFEDQVIPEVIDPSTGEVLPHGEQGELVLTTITKEAMPLIRFRTGDSTAIIEEPCACNRIELGLKMARVKGRVDDSIEVSGIQISAGKIEDVLKGIGGGLPRFQVTIDREQTSDIVEVHVELSNDVFLKDRGINPGLEQRLKHEIKSQLIDLLGSEVRLKFYPPMGLSGVLERRGRIVDKRFLRQ